MTALSCRSGKEKARATAGFPLAASRGALGCRSRLALDATLDLQGFRRKLPIGRAQKESIEAALAIDGPHCTRRQTETNHLAEGLTQQGRGLHVRQKAPARLVVRVAHVIPRENALTCDHATSCHFTAPESGAGRRETPESAHF